MSITTSYFSQMDSNGFTITGKCKHYQTYQEMLADTKPGQYGTVQDASGDPQFTTAPKGMVVYERKNDEWILSYGMHEIICHDVYRDYSAFEVYAHDQRIEAGSLDGTVHSKYIGKPGDVITRAVLPSMTHAFKIRTLTPPDKQNVLVDWGDGITTRLSDVIPTGTSEYRYEVSHTYEKVGTYIVKIFGTTYFSFMGSNDPNTSLISRVFDYDLPLASHIWNMSSGFMHNQRLLHVDMYSHRAATQIRHWDNAFTSCINLINCEGFTQYIERLSCRNMFNNCVGLQYTDMRLCTAPSDVAGGCGNTYEKCYELNVDINDLLPPQGFRYGATINMTNTFRAMYKLHGTVPADKLWNNPNVTFTNTEKAFELCSDEIRAQVPVSWGGTMEA